MSRVVIFFTEIIVFEVFNGFDWELDSIPIVRDKSMVDRLELKSVRSAINSWIRIRDKFLDSDLQKYANPRVQG